VNQALAARIGAALDRPLDPLVAAFAARLGKEAGARAVLFYGSNLRTGSLEGVLDFYVLLPGPAERGLWPRVSYREDGGGAQVLRAKIATMHLTTFAQAAEGRTLDTTIWARFAQPSALAWAGDPDAGADLTQALAAAARTAARLAAAVGPVTGSEEDYWAALFRATYRAELRVEPAGRERSILLANPAHFAGLLASAWAEAGVTFDILGDSLRPRLPAAERQAILRWWRRRRRMGKPLNIVRLIRATATFEGAMRYVAWKVERHTGVPIKVTPLREKYPLLAAPDLVWQLWRARRRKPAPVEQPRRTR
jgi:hypothetical protein